MFDFQWFATVGVLTLLITLFLIVCGLYQVAPMFMAVLTLTSLAIYFGNK